jgi:Tol biopolymer transport system component
MAAILERDPPAVSTLQPLASPALDQMVRTCLAKDPDARWQTTHDLLLQLKWIGETRAQAGVAVAARARGKFRERIAWGLAAASIVFAAAIAILSRQHSAEPRAVRLQFSLPETMKMDDFDYPVISPDGERVILPGIAADGVRHLWLHSLDSITDQLLLGTEGAYCPFWSPDNSSVAFFTETKLKRIAAAGGLAQTICNSKWPNGGGTWNRDDVILFSGTSGSGIFRVSAGGGEPRPVIKPQKARNQRFPHFLPDGRHFLYLSAGGGKHDVSLSSLDGQDALVLIPEGGAASYVSPGFVIYGIQETLFAQRFDAGRLRLSGDAVPIAEHVGRWTTDPVMLASNSQNGVMVYSGGGVGLVQLAWHDWEGAQQTVIGQPGVYQELDLSPDERRLALRRANAATGTDEIWILEISTGILSRLTTQTSDEAHWSPNSRELVFSSDEKGGPFCVYRKTVGESEQTLIFEADKDAWAAQWLPDDTVLIEAPTLYRVPVAGDRKSVTLRRTDVYTGGPHVSPDGRWVAYYVAESGRFEVYVAAFPSFKGKRQVSNSGGCQPQWRKDLKELFYLSLDGKMMSVAVRGDTNIETSAPKQLFRFSLRVDTNNSQYAVSKDGKRFLFGEPTTEASRFITVVLNWPAVLKH